MAATEIPPSRHENKIAPCDSIQSFEDPSVDVGQLMRAWMTPAAAIEIKGNILGFDSDQRLGHQHGYENEAIGFPDGDNSILSFSDWGSSEIQYQVRLIRIAYFCQVQSFLGMPEEFVADL